ncbi:hypothetical protein AAC387_Pa12g0570 [Persea americana]
MESNSYLFAYLPDCVLLLIVSFLPFKEAARTSVLSKRWKQIWRDYTTIELNENFFRNTADQAMAPLKKLTSLTIVDCIPLDEGVWICAPKLEDFKYYGAFEAFELDDVASIKNVDHDSGVEHMFFILGDPLCDLLESFDYADVLKFCSYITQV